MPSVCRLFMPLGISASSCQSGLWVPPAKATLVMVPLVLVSHYDPLTSLCSLPCVLSLLLWPF